jgi:primosomal protein N' (replication factor Y) (superfamily II helicase)
MLAEILLPLKIGKQNGSLTYQIPKGLKVCVGNAVRIPLRNQTKTGLVRELHERKLTFEPKEILSIKEGEEILAPWQLELAEWVADYYFAPLYKVLKMMLPKKMWEPERGTPHEMAFRRTNIEAPEKLGAKQTEVLAQFESSKTLSRKELGEFSLATLRSLVKKELLEEVIGEIAGVNLGKAPQSEPKTLTPEQQKIYDGVLSSDKKVSLIHGVTGSGKTEIYFQLAQKIVASGKQIILMVPEISLTPQFIEYFAHEFKEKIAVLHSRLSLGEREREWWRIHEGTAQVIIGSRSAIFAPSKNLGLIIIDEEHEWSYKQDKSPHYHARKVALKISALTEAKVVLGSATPDIETRYAAKTERINLFKLNERILGRSLPEVEVVDMREELHKKNFSIFSDALYTKLQETLEKKEQAILFLNRRGHSSSILCRDCGYTAECKNCDVSLTHHKSRAGNEWLTCHHCAANQNMPEICPECSGAAIKSIGIGTQQVEDELIKRFPSAQIARADKDTTSKKDSFDKLYQALKNQEIDILVGTQMIGKGLDLPNVTLVGVVLADIGLHIPDFRAAERNFQLMMQVAGRAGRAQKKGHVVIQTYNPDHPSLENAAGHKYLPFFETEIASRRALNYPPFTRTIKLTFKHFEQKTCSQEAQSLASNLSHQAKDHIINCAPALIYKKHNKFRYHVYIQGPNPHATLTAFLKNSPLKEGWAIDTDPVVMN